MNKIYDERNCTTEEERKEFEKEKKKYDPEIEQVVKFGKRKLNLKFSEFYKAVKQFKVNVIKVGFLK